MIVKICGLTRIEDALAAAVLGADFLGFVFAASPRRVDARRVAEIRDVLLAAAERGELPSRSIPPMVGVFVDEDPAVVRRVARESRLDAVQLHGSESPGYCCDMPVPVIKAFRVRDEESLRGVEDYRRAAAFLLFDAWHPDLAGGSGRMADLSLLRGVVRLGVPWFLAGGLRPDNVEAALEASQPDGVDVSGGVESSPGIKDSELMREFITKAKGGIRG